MTKRLTSRSGKRRVTTWIEEGLIRKLKAESEGRSVSQQRIIETMLVERYSVDLKEDRDALFIRRLNAIDTRLKLLERQADIQMESFALFLRMWLASTDEIPEDQRQAAAAQAQARYQHFLESVSRRLEMGKSFFVELPRENILEHKDFRPNAKD